MEARWASRGSSARQGAMERGRCASKKCEAARNEDKVTDSLIVSGGDWK
jgi:hypothetical protein